MDWHNVSLKKEEYEEIKDYDHADLSSWGNKNLPDSVIFGYGFYGISKPFEKDGKYFVPVLMGDSCD